MALFSYVLAFIGLFSLNCKSQLLTKSCESLLEGYAISCSSFMHCAVSHARPIKMCQNCWGSYVAVNEDYSSILNLSEEDNVTCRDALLNLDRLAIIEAGHSYATTLWDKAKCENCFEPHHSSPLTPSNDTLVFQNLYDKVNECVKGYHRDDDDKYSPDVCSNCSTEYYMMNKFYNQMKIKFGDGNICMDLVDAMNVTQNLWSGTLHCGGHNQSPEIAVIAIITVFFSLPVLFYAAAWKFSPTSPSFISQQKRLSTRFIQRWRTRTGSLISYLRN